MKLRKLIFTKNACYKRNVEKFDDRYTTFQDRGPKGIMVHSTAANNPWLKRYVGPDDGLLGKNIFGNHWNCGNLSVCVHAFIGKMKDGSIATYQTLPWNYRGWHAGGDANNTHISFEICEDNLKNATYFKKVYQEAVELTAMLCKEYNLDPLADGVVICHSEGYQRGIASNHGDVMHWFPKYGKSMDTFRKDVDATMRGVSTGSTTTEPKGENTVNIELTVLKRGSKGNQVKAVQRMLYSMGYDLGASKVDGDFGSKTDVAIRAYQKKNGLEADGIVGSATWKKLLGV